jgi:hypothetical protein
MAMRRGGPARLGLLGTLLSDERLSGVLASVAVACLPGDWPTDRPPPSGVRPGRVRPGLLDPAGPAGPGRLGQAVMRVNGEVCDADAFRRSVIVCRMGVSGSPEIVSVCDSGRGVPQTPHVHASMRRTKDACCACG